MFVLTTILVSLCASGNVTAGDVECQTVKGRGFQQSFQEQCEFDGTAFDLCIGFKLLGSDFISYDAYGNFSWANLRVEYSVFR